MKLPELFLEKMKYLLGEEYERYIESFHQKRVYGLRVNTSKISTEEFEKICPFQIEKIPWISNGYYYDKTAQPAKHPYYYAGLYYLQEPSAMTPASRLEVNKGERVLDLCAAPGGKATELGARLQGDGILVANDVSASRAKALLKNLEIFGIPNFYVVTETPEKLSERFPEFFDKILIDAPCSGEGMFRKDSAVIKEWEKKGPSVYAEIQKKIVTEAAKMLKPGGKLLYSTCTFDPLENEGTIQFLLNSEPGFQILPIESWNGFSKGRPDWIEDGRKELENCVRIFPHKMEGEGHFLALLQKEGESREQFLEKRNRTELKKEEKTVLEAFFQNVKKEINWDRISLQADRVYLISEEIGDLKGIHFMRSGLYLGDLKKNRFEPSQAFAMTLKPEEYASVIRIPAGDSRVIRYLKGETIETENLLSAQENGWQLVCVDNFSLGWGKLINGTLKNKYLPGWRWQ